MKLDYLLRIIVLVFLAVLVGYNTPGYAGTVVRTLAYHQITGPTDLFGSSPIRSILSADGSRVALTLPPSGTGDPAQPNRIFVMNPDGTGLQQVDSYLTFCFCDSFVDISADGSKVVSTDSVQIRIANGDGSGATPLIALDSNEINDLAISGDGTKVFFRIYRNTSFRGTNPAIPIENGIYVINANGSGLRQIAGPAQLAALTGLPLTDLAFFGSNTPYSTLRSSHDGSRIIFSSMVAPGSGGIGQRLFGVNLDGGGLHDFFGQQNWIFQSTISSDGAKVGYTIEPTNGPPSETGTINFDGSGRLKLFDSSQGLQFYLSRHQLSNDGSHLFIADSGVLFNTDGSGLISLGLRGFGEDSDLVYDGLSQATMNGAANKFLYWFRPHGEPFQFARLDLNPDSLGASPSLTQPSINPAIVALNGASTATETVRASSGVSRVTNRPLFKGLPDNNVGSGALVDDGTQGDSIAGDGLFTNNGLAANCCAATGPHLMRFKAETTDVNGKRHATAIDYDGFLVVETLPSLTINDVNVLEGNSVNFSVTLSAASSADVTVNYATANGSATAPDDYTTISGTLTILAGQTKGVINVSTVGDTLDELNETFFVNLSVPSGATISDTQGRGIIIDNDSLPAVTIGDVTVTEGDSGETNATFTIQLSAASGQIISINAIPSNGSARAPFDYTSGGARLIFAPGETTKTFSVPVKGDTLDEPDETFVVILSSPVNCAVGRGRGVGTILDDDAGPSITIDDVRIGEGNAGQRTAAFRLRLSAPSGQVVRVNYSTTGNTATAGADFVAVPETQIAFTTGNIFAYARVLINGDVLNEADETFNVNLSSPIGATIADSQAIGAILNDDSAPALTINDVSAVEGNGGTATLTFTVTLSKPSGQDVTVKYATSDGIARSTSDYVAGNGTLIIAAGQTSQTTTVQINGDTQVEGDETFFVFLSGATNASIGRARGVGTITNDDSSG